MEDFLALLVKYGPGIGLAVIVAGIVQSLKIAFKKFFTQSTLGMRLMPFLPLVLGMLGGLCLPNQPTIMSKLLVGGALGTLSSVIYQAITRTFAKGSVLQQKIAAKSGNTDPVPEETVPETGGPGDEVK